jgi:hypothetical protein
VTTLNPKQSHDRLRSVQYLRFEDEVESKVELSADSGVARGGGWGSRGGGGRGAVGEESYGGVCVGEEKGGFEGGGGGEVEREGGGVGEKFGELGDDQTGRGMQGMQGIQGCAAWRGRRDAAKALREKASRRLALYREQRAAARAALDEQVVAAAGVRALKARLLGRGQHDTVLKLPKQDFLPLAPLTTILSIVYICTCLVQLTTILFIGVEVAGAGLPALGPLALRGLCCY